MSSIGTLGKSHKPFETNEKMKLAKQATTKKYFVTLSGWEISIVVTAISYEKTKEIMIWMTKTRFPTLNRLNLLFQSIHSISPVLYKQLWILIMYVIYVYY